MRRRRLDWPRVRLYATGVLIAAGILLGLVLLATGELGSSLSDDCAFRTGGAFCVTEKSAR